MNHWTSRLNPWVIAIGSENGKRIAQIRSLGSVVEIIEVRYRKRIPSNELVTVFGPDAVSLLPEEAKSASAHFNRIRIANPCRVALASALPPLGVRRQRVRRSLAGL
jgi:hypothetical protein